MNFHSRWFLLLPVVAVLAALLVHTLGAGPVTMLRNSLFDQYQRWQPRAAVELPVTVVDVDEYSLARFGQWPWARTVMARLVERLTEAEVAVAAFDIVFAEHDRSAPRALAGLWDIDDALRARLLSLPDHDDVFAGRLAQLPTVLGFFVLADGVGAAPPPPRASYVHLGAPQGEHLAAFATAVRNLEVLEAAAQGNGALSYLPDSDGVVRRVPVVLQVAGEPAAGLAAEALRVAQGATVVMLRSAGHRSPRAAAMDAGGLVEVRIGDFVVPVGAGGDMWVYYRGDGGVRRLSAATVMDDDETLRALAGHIVLLGSSAPGLLDLRFTPFGLAAGVDIHAEVVEQMLAGQFLSRPRWASAAELGALVCAGLLAGALALRLRALPAALCSAILLALCAGLSWQAFARHGVLLDPLTPAAGVLAGFMLCGLLHHLQTEREQRWIRQAFARYVSPNRVAHLLAHQETMALGGRRQQCSFIFTDLADFTALMETLDPAQAVTLLNDYLDDMIAIAFRHEGTLDRIVGDALAIMFSAPLEQPDHRARAYACALEMDAYARGCAARLRARGIAFGDTRIGVHCGEVIVGNFGGKTIFDYRALGDAVNTAARLEGANKHLGTRVCISATIVDAVPQAAVRPVGLVVLKGRHQALAVFEPLDAGEDDRRAPLADYLTAYAALAEAPTTALARFAVLHRMAPEDGLVAMHYRRLQAGGEGEGIVLGEK